MLDYTTQFRDAIRAAGLTPPERIDADGKVHRFASNGERKDDAGWYVLYPDGVPAGAFGCWRKGFAEDWRADIGRKLTREEEAAYRKRVGEAGHERAAVDARKRAEAAETATRTWNVSTPIGDHPYLKRKGVKAHGVRHREGAVVIPIRDVHGELTSLEFINADGEKLFLPGGRIAGCFYLIGQPDGVLCIAEGFATAATIRECTGHAVATAFSAGNLEPVARALRGVYPDARIVVCGDNDANETGQRKARAAAGAVGGAIAIPQEAGRDWNDIRADQGAEAVRRAIAGQFEAPAVATQEIPATVASISDEPPAVVAGTSPLDAVHAFLSRFVALPSAACLDVVTLWAAHAHMVEHFHTSPRLAALSPEPESGKTRVLEILDLLTPNAMLILSPSVAAIFRKLAQDQVTLLFDEVDTIFTRRGKDDQNEDLRALLNAGYRRGASIPRCVGPKHEVQDFRVFAATALAGIGDLPETVMTRSIVLRMRRRSSSEQIEQFRVRVHEEQGHAVRDQLAAWAAAVGRATGAAWPALPDGVVDRKAEAWEPLIAVADAAGGDWPERARKAAVTFVSDVSLSIGMSASLGIRLLTDLRQVFGERDAASTEDLLKALIALDESPWGELRGRALNARGLAMRLRRYGITSRQVRLGDRTAKGYRREDLHDTWIRYLPPITQFSPHLKRKQGNRKLTLTPLKEGKQGKQT